MWSCCLGHSGCKAPYNDAALRKALQEGTSSLGLCSKGWSLTIVIAWQQEPSCYNTGLYIS